MSRRRTGLAVAALGCAIALAAGTLACRGALRVDKDAGPSLAGAPIGGTPGDLAYSEAVESKGFASETEDPSGTSAVPEAAASLVREYEQRSDCVLVRSGYLDLSGQVWSMVVEGAGWVDVCIVQDANDGTSETKVMHMDVSEWAASLDALGLGG